MKINRQFIKKALLITGCTAVFISIAAVPAGLFFLNTIDLNKYTGTIFQKIENETGFKVSCEKAELKKSISPYITLNLYHTGILYPDNTKFMQIKEADFKIKIIPLIFKKIEIKDALIERPIITVNVYKDFSNSIEKYFPENLTPIKNGFSINKFISLIKCRNYKIKFNDKTINKTFYLEGSELDLTGHFNESINIKTKGALYADEKEYIKYDIDTASDFDFKNIKNPPFNFILENDLKGAVYARLKHKKSGIDGILRVNDLSLKLDNVLSSNNMAEIIFKGSSAEINAVLHTSKKDKAEIYGRFDFGKKHFIDLNTKAENADIKNLAGITKSVLKILNIKNPLNDVNFKGLINADFNIKSDFKELKSKGTAKITGGYLKHKNFEYPVSDINADISFNNNEINIINAGAAVNKTPLMIAGTVKKDMTADLKAYADEIDLKTAIGAFIDLKKIPFDIKKGSLSFKADIKGNLGKELNTNVNADIKNLLMFEKQLKIPVSMEALVFTLSDNRLKMHKNTALIAGSNIQTSGEASFLNSSPEVHIDFSGAVNASETASILKQYIKLPYKASGNLKTAGTINIAENNLKIKASIDADKDNYISYAVIKELYNKQSHIDIEAEADKNILNIKNISLKEALIESDEPLIKVSGKILNSKTPVLKDIHLQTGSAVTFNSNFAGGEEISLKSDIVLNNSIKSPEIKGNLKLIKLNLKKYSASAANADIVFYPDKIRLSAPDTSVKESVFNITADIEPDFEKLTVSDMHVNSVNLDLNSLFDIIYSEQNIFASPSIVIKKGSAAINKFKVLNLKAEDTGADFKFENNIFKVFNINAKSYAGSVSGSFDYEAPSGFLKIKMTGKNLDIKNSLYDLCGFDDNISGRADFYADVSMLAGLNNTALKTLSGYAEFNAENGSMGTLGRFEYYLKAQNLLRSGLANSSLNKIVQSIADYDTAHYKNSYGRLVFKNGFMKPDKVYVQGVNMSLMLSGAGYNLLLNRADFDIYGRIKNEIIKNIYKDDGGYREENLVTIMPSSLINEIPNLYNNNTSSNTFKVNVKGDIKALNSIKTFEWTASDEADILENKEENDELPDFSDL